MKSATARQLRNDFPTVVAWLEAGEEVLLTRHGRAVGRIIPEQASPKKGDPDQKERFARRFAPLKSKATRDLASLVGQSRERE